MDLIPTEMDLSPHPVPSPELSVPHPGDISRGGDSKLPWEAHRNVLTTLSVTKFLPMSKTPPDFQGIFVPCIHHVKLGLPPTPPCAAPEHPAEFWGRFSLLFHSLGFPGAQSPSVSPRWNLWKFRSCGCKGESAAPADPSSGGLCWFCASKSLILGGKRSESRPGNCHLKTQLQERLVTLPVPRQEIHLLFFSSSDCTEPVWHRSWAGEKRRSVSGERHKYKYFSRATLRAQAGLCEGSLHSGVY